MVINHLLNGMILQVVVDVSSVSFFLGGDIFLRQNSSWAAISQAQSIRSDELIQQMKPG